jgi:hypothetical protein
MSAAAAAIVCPPELEPERRRGSPPPPTPPRQPGSAEILPFPSSRRRAFIARQRGHTDAQLNALINAHINRLQRLGVDFARAEADVAELVDALGMVRVS